MSVIIRNQQKYEGAYKSLDNVGNKVTLKAKKILVYKEVHEFFETAQSCFSYPLYELLLLDLHVEYRLISLYRSVTESNNFVQSQFCV